MQYHTFNEAAKHRGLLENDDGIKDCLMDASNTHMPTHYEGYSLRFWYTVNQVM